MLFQKTFIFLVCGIALFLFGGFSAYAGEILSEKSPQMLSGKVLIEEKRLSGSGRIKDFSTGSIRTGAVSEPSMNSIVETGATNESQESKIDEKEKQEIREEINDLILGSIMKKSRKAVDNFSNMIEERYSSREEKIDAYKRIQRTLELRIGKIEENPSLKENGKFILKEYLNNMIALLDKKIEELK